MATNTASQVKVARLEVQVEKLQADVADIKADQKSQNGKLDLLVADLNRRTGATTVSKAVVGLIMSSGFLGWLWEHFHR